MEPFSIDHFQKWVEENELTLEDGEPWQLEPFQLAIVADVFAGFREVWAIIPEGNAKTTLMGGVALYHADHTSAPWVPIGAAARDQAKIMFRQAGGFVNRSARMKERFKVFEGYREIRCHTGGWGIQVYAADANTGDGVIPTLALVDELHRHKDLRLYRLWKGKLGKRGGQIVAISTAGEPGSEFEELRETIRQSALDRERDSCYLRAQGKKLAYHEWMIPDQEQARDLDVVKAANPLEHITKEYLQEKLESETLDFGEDWLRLTCNIPTRSSYAAIPELEWDACETDEQIPAGVPVAVGADLAFLEDTTAITPLYVRDEHFRLFGEPHILVPPGDGTMLDVNEIKDAFLVIHERNPIDVVVMDPNKAQDIAQWLSNELGLTVISREQTNAWAAKDYEFFMEGLRERWIRHTGDPGFRQHALAAIRARLPGDKHRFDRPRTLRKARKDNKRIVIDALSAACFVHTHIAMNTSIYDEREMVII